VCVRARAYRAQQLHDRVAAEQQAHRLRACVCVRARARASVWVGACVGVCGCVRACVRAVCVHARVPVRCAVCVHARVAVRVCVPAGTGRRTARARALPPTAASRA
jgi:hypothetical protein